MNYKGRICTICCYYDSSSGRCISPPKNRVPPVRCKHAHPAHGVECDFSEIDLPAYFIQINADKRFPFCQLPAYLVHRFQCGGASDGIEAAELLMLPIHVIKVDGFAAAPVANHLAIGRFSVETEELVVRQIRTNGFK